MQAATHALTNAKERNPAHLAPHFYLGRVSALQAQRAWTQGRHPQPAWSRAVQHYRNGIAINSKVPPLHNGLGMVKLRQAEYRWWQDEDPAQSMQEAQAAFQKAIAIAPKQPHGYNGMGVLHWYQASWQQQSGQDPTIAAEAAEAAYQQALVHAPKQAFAWANLAEVSLLQAEWALLTGHTPDKLQQTTQLRIQTALNHQPEHALSLRLQGCLHLLEAQQKQPPPVDVRKVNELFSAAVHTLERSLTQDSEVFETQITLAKALLQQAAWHRLNKKAYTEIEERGRKLIDEALKQRPNSPRAKRVRARLLELVER